MLSNHLILCCPLLLLPSIFPNIRVFSNESALTSMGSQRVSSLYYKVGPFLLSINILSIELCTCSKLPVYPFPWQLNNKSPISYLDNHGSLFSCSPSCPLQSTTNTAFQFGQFMFFLHSQLMIKNQHPPMVPKALKKLPLLLHLWPHLLLYSSLTLLHSHWLPYCSSNKPGTLPSWGSCTGSLCLECFSRWPQSSFPHLLQGFLPLLVHPI